MELRRCERCAKPFGGYRADARFCSSPCRQAAYRARERELTVYFPDPDERDAARRFSAASEAEFEAALRLARRCGDLSRSGVVKALDVVTDIAVTGVQHG